MLSAGPRWALRRHWQAFFRREAQTELALGDHGLDKQASKRESKPESQKTRKQEKKASKKASNKLLN